MPLYLVVLFVMFALLAGVVLLVIFVMPKHRPPAHAISLMEEYEKLLTRTTMSPLLPKSETFYLKFLIKDAILFTIVF